MLLTRRSAFPLARCTTVAPETVVSDRMAYLIAKKKKKKKKSRPPWGAARWPRGPASEEALLLHKSCTGVDNLAFIRV